MKMLKREKRGIALIMALWIMVALLVICASFVYMMRIELRIAKNYLDGVKAHYLAKAGIAHALGKLVNDNVDIPPNYRQTDSLHEDWFQTFVSDGSLHPAIVYYPYGTSFGYTEDYNEMLWDEKGFLLGNGGYEVRLIDEAGMHNINAQEGGMRNPDSLIGMEDLLADGQDPIPQTVKDKACRIRDYRDSDTDDMVSSTYFGGGPPGVGDDGTPAEGFKNYPYDTIREIQKVKDINADTNGDVLDDNPLAKHTNELTVCSRDYDVDLNGYPRVNLNTALQIEIQDALEGLAYSPYLTAYSIYTNRPPATTYPNYTCDGWQTVGQIHGQIALPAGYIRGGDWEAREMKRIADKFTVAPTGANPIYKQDASGRTYILGAININTAPKKSLCSLYNISAARSEHLIEARHGVEDLRNYICEGAVMSDTFTFGVADDAHYGRGELMLARGLNFSVIDHCSDQVTVRSDRFRIVSTGRVGIDGDGDGKIDPDNPADTVVAQRKIEAVVDRNFHNDGNMGPFEILYWSEAALEY